MLSLRSHDIIPLFVWIDDLFPEKQRSVGRPAVLHDSEVLTILVWNVLTVGQPTLRRVYEHVKVYQFENFPCLPVYSKFVEHCHRVMPLLYQLLSELLCFSEPLRLVDSTMLEVCKLVRADSHKVARNIAAFGKNHQGWHYGFKLHTSVNTKGSLCGIALTPANVHDAQMLPFITNQQTKIAVGDTSYGARVMREHLWKTQGTFVLAYPHPKQKKKLIASWQHVLLTFRPKIESVFDYLKNHLHLVTSFPRSIKGYLLHYLRILLGYQLLSLISEEK